MKIIPLSGRTQDREKYTHKIILEYTDIDTSNATNDVVQIFPYDATPLAPTATVPAGTVVRACGMQLITAFAGNNAGVNPTGKITIGHGGVVNKYLASTEVHTYGTEVTHAVHPAANVPFIYTSADGIDLEFKGVNVNCDELTAGKLEIYLEIGSHLKLDEVK